MAAGGRGPGTHTDEPVTILWSASPFPHPPLSSPAVRSASRAWWVAATNCVAAVAPHPRSPPPSPTCLPAYLCTCSRTCPPVRPPSPCALAAPRRPARPPTCSTPPRTNGGASRTLSLPPPPLPAQPRDEVAWARALEGSYLVLSARLLSSGRLVGFCRATTDGALASLVWDVVADTALAQPVSGGWGEDTPGWRRGRGRMEGGARGSLRGRCRGCGFWEKGGEGVGKGARRLRGWRETATATSTLVFQLVRALSAS